MDVLVGDDGVALLREARDGGAAGNVAGDADVAGLAAEERGELLLKFGVVGAGAVGDAGAGGASAPFARGLAGGLDHLWVKGQAEVIVAGEHHHVAPLQADARALLRLHRVIVGLVFEAHLRRVVILRAFDDRLLGLGEQRQGHGSRERD